MSNEKNVEQEDNQVREHIIVYSVRDAASVLGISASLLYNELKRNPDFPRSMVGGRILIPAKKLEKYFNS